VNIVFVKSIWVSSGYFMQIFLYTLQLYVMDHNYNIKIMELWLLRKDTAM